MGCSGCMSGSCQLLVDFWFHFLFSVNQSAVSSFFIPFSWFDLLVLLNQRKVGVFLHGFALVGIGVVTAGVAEDASQPCSLFFNGQELGFTVHFLVIS